MICIRNREYNDEWGVYGLVKEYIYVRFWRFFIVVVLVYFIVKRKLKGGVLFKFISRIKN